MDLQAMKNTVANNPAVQAAAASAAGQAPKTSEPATGAPPPSSATAAAGASVAPPDAAPPQDDEISKRFLSLTAKEKAISAEKKRLEELKKKYEGYEKAFSEKDKNPFSVLDAAGLTLDQLIDYKLAQTDGKKPEDDKYKTLEEKVAELTSKLTAEEERKKQEHQSKEIGAFKSSIKSVLDADHEQFGLTALTDSYDAVYSSIQDVVSQAIAEAQENGEPIPYQTREEVEALIPKVAAQVEEQLFEALKKVQALGKVKSLFAAAETPPKDTVTPPVKDIPAPERTLTNSNSVPSGAGTRQSYIEDRDESLRIAKAKLNAAWGKK